MPELAERDVVRAATGGIALKLSRNRIARSQRMTHYHRSINSGVCSMLAECASGEIIGTRLAQAGSDPTDELARDRAWIERIRCGDDAAFEGMVRAYYEPLVRFAASRLGAERDEARDLVQDALFRIWKQREHWKVHNSLATYLYGAVRNHCVDHVRRCTTEEQWQHAVADADGVDADMWAKPRQTVDAADSLVEADEMSRAIADAIARLPGRCRRAFMLQHGRGLSYPEIAEVMGTSPNTVRVQIGRAHKILRAMLGSNLGACSALRLARRI